MKISAVVLSRNEGDWLRETVANLADTLPGDREIVVVDDGSEDGSAAFLRGRKKPARLIRTEGVGMTRGRNLGARRCTGQVIVFCDAHMRFERDWWRPLLDVLERPDSGAAASIVGSTEGDPQAFGYGFTLPNPDMAPAWLPDRSSSEPFHAPFLPGCCLAMKREVFDATGGYDEGLLSRGSVDAELGIRFWLSGYENWMVPQSRVWHHFRRHAPFKIPHSDAIHNRLRTALVHFSYWRVTSVMQALAADACIGPAMLQVVQGDVDRRRKFVQARRKWDDDWLWKKFNVRW